MWMEISADYKQGKGVMGVEQLATKKKGSFDFKPFRTAVLKAVANKTPRIFMLFYPFKMDNGTIKEKPVYFSVEPVGAPMRECLIVSGTIGNLHTEVGKVMGDKLNLKFEIRVRDDPEKEVTEEKIIAAMSMFAKLPIF